MGDRSRQMGFRGISNAVEDIIAARDILLAKETGTALHLCHCSTEDSVRMIKEAKEEGLPVSGEVCPHHFTLSTDDIRENDGNYESSAAEQKRCGGIAAGTAGRHYGCYLYGSCTSRQRGKGQRL